MISRLQKILFVVSIVFVFWSAASGLAQYFGLSLSFLRGFADTEGISNPAILRLVPVGRADLNNLKKGDVFLARTFTGDGLPIGDITLSVKIELAPEGGQPQEIIESADWALQDSAGTSIHQITDSSPPGIYKILAFRDKRISDWMDVSSVPGLVIKIASPKPAF